MQASTELSYLTSPFNLSALQTIPGAGGSVQASTELSYLTSPFNLSALQTIPGAGGSVQASTELSYLTSPFYPLKYFSNNKLAWIISAPKFSIITIEVMPLINFLIFNNNKGRRISCYIGNIFNRVSISSYSTTNVVFIYNYFVASSPSKGFINPFAV